MFTVILGILEAGLSLWANKEKHKYVDKLIALKKEYYAEINKPYEQRNNAALDGIEFELRILAVAFASDVSREKA